MIKPSRVDGGPVSALAPSAWIARFAPLVPAGARVLDVAAGQGRHARLFAARGAHVVAVDVDAAALANLDGVRNVTTRVAGSQAMIVTVVTRCRALTAPGKVSDVGAVMGATDRSTSASPAGFGRTLTTSKYDAVTRSPTLT